MDRVKLREELERDEGKRLHAYLDTNGFWTIGIGHLLGSTCRMSQITEQECTALLNVDIDAAESDARSIFEGYDTLSDDRQRALVNMIFNRGRQRVLTSTSITPAIKVAIKTGNPEDWNGVKVAIAQSQWAQQVGPRSERIAVQLGSG